MYLKTLQAIKNPQPLPVMGFVYFFESQKICVWRRGRDSNPGRVSPQRFSRPPLSAAQPPLRKECALYLCFLKLTSQNLKKRHKSEKTKKRTSFLLMRFIVLMFGIFSIAKAISLQADTDTSSTLTPPHSTQLNKATFAFAIQKITAFYNHEGGGNERVVILL